MTKDLFVPLGTDKSVWDFSKEIVFLDSFFESQLTKEEKKSVKYSLLPSENLMSCKSDIVFFEGHLIYCLSEFLNSLHNVSFDYTFYRKLFVPWIETFICNVFSKVEDFERLKKYYPDSFFFTGCESEDFNKKFLKKYSAVFFSEEYNNYIYVYIGKRFYNFCVDRYKSSCNVSTVGKMNAQTTQNNALSQTFFARLKRLTLRKIFNKLNRVRSKIFKPRLMLWCTYFSPEAIDYFRTKSFGKIAPLNIDNMDFDAEYNNNIRENLGKALNAYFLDKKLSIKETILLDLLTLCIPYFYIENFDKYLNTAKDFCAHNENVKLFFATCTYCRELVPFLLTYAQAVGKKF